MALLRASKSWHQLVAAPQSPSILRRYDSGITGGIFASHTFLAKVRLGFHA